MKNKLALTAIVAFSLTATAFTITAYADTPAIPQWIKNNAKWWSEGTIPDSDFLKGMQYLIQQGIIQVPTSVPVPTVTATNSGLSDSTMAKSFVVHFKTTTLTFDVYTISKIAQFGQTTTTQTSNATPLSGTGAPQFQFESIPSKDKSKYYTLIAYYINNSGTNKDLVDVSIDILTGDGSIIETLQYANCQVSSYYTYVNDNKENYRFSGNDVSELRDDANFVCQGLHILLPQATH